MWKRSACQRKTLKTSAPCQRHLQPISCTCKTHKHAGGKTLCSWVTKIKLYPRLPLPRAPPAAVWSNFLDNKLQAESACSLPISGAQKAPATAGGDGSRVRAGNIPDT